MSDARKQRPLKTINYQSKISVSPKKLCNKAKKNFNKCTIMFCWAPWYDYTLNNVFVLMRPSSFLELSSFFSFPIVKQFGYFE